MIILTSTTSLNKASNINKTASPLSAPGSHLSTPIHEGKTWCRWMEGKEMLWDTSAREVLQGKRQVEGNAG